jgi:NifU-like protein involved in Fe-S cluster formation
MDYSDAVLRRFAGQPRRPDRAQDDAEVVTAEAEDRSLNLWVRFELRHSGGSIDAIRYSVFGCPHAIAAAGSLADALEGKPLAALLEPDIQATARELNLPREKFGKLLRMEDALRELASLAAA